ncbi:MAG: hypothetical protein J1G30_04455 [Spirochaetales bacterium]|nr:hypothetical protein [Spirochaetales bacterium]
MKQIEIMDTTLRDGEQMQGISFTPSEKLTIAEILLSKVKVDRLEVASARVSEGEQKGVEKIVDWANKFGFTEKLEILTFVDYDKSANWAIQTGITCINLLTKGSLKHCEQQLKKTPKEHRDDIEKTLKYAFSKNLSVNVYLEDFSNGILCSPDYLFAQIDFLKNFPIKRIMLPDTLGVMEPFCVFENIKKIIEKYPDLHFDFHPHNDYGLATANALAAVKAGAAGVHLSVNGMGERAGNASLDEVCVGLRDFLNVNINIEEKELFTASQYVEIFSGQRMQANKPIYGKNSFTQTAGVHADGDKKGDLYVNRLKPERFGRHREYALGKLSGKANLEMNLKELGISLSEEKKNTLLQTIIELGDKKTIVSVTDLPFIINDIFETKTNNDFKVLNFSINSTYKLKSIANVRCSFQGKEAEESSQGDGGYDAFMNALKIILKQFEIQMPKLIDYTVEIPPGGRTNALVQTIITWEIIQPNGETKRVTTKGLNHDQNTAAIEATLKIINFILSVTPSVIT